MRSLTTALSATVTAVVLALVISNIATAARAAEIANAKDQRLAALEATSYAADTQAQLDAYQTRYEEAYAKLSAAYQVLLERDAAYRASFGGSDANVGRLAATNALLEARLAEAYGALADAQAMLDALARQRQVTTTPSSTTTPGPGVTASAAPRTATPQATTVPAASSTPRPTPTLYCFYDHEGHYQCEDHPPGG